MGPDTMNDKLIARLTVEAFLADYMLAIDSDRLEEWGDFFTPDGKESRDGMPVISFSRIASPK